MNVAATDAVPPKKQIKDLVEEGMENIARAIFGENLPFRTRYRMSALTVDGVGVALADTYVSVSPGQRLTITADVPVRYPDEKCDSYHLDDMPFIVEASGWAKSMRFEAWCEHNPHSGIKTIVRQVANDGHERWLVADAMEGEVLYRGPWQCLFPWAKEIVAQKWPHLSHVCIDTETKAMNLFVRSQQSN